MPYIFISTVAMCANLYRCAPLIVGDRYADPDLMKFLGARITTDYPKPNSPPIYVMLAPLRAVLNSLQDIGYNLLTAQVVEGYYTWVLLKPQIEKDGEEKSSDKRTKQYPCTTRLPNETKDKIDEDHSINWRSGRKSTVSTQTDVIKSTSGKLGNESQATNDSRRVEQGEDVGQQKRQSSASTQTDASITTLQELYEATLNGKKQERKEEKAPVATQSKNQIHSSNQANQDQKRKSKSKGSKAATQKEATPSPDATVEGSFDSRIFDSLDSFHKTTRPEQYDSGEDNVPAKTKPHNSKRSKDSSTPVKSIFKE